MRSAWNVAEAADYIARYAEKGVPEALALRVYTSRLLGREPKLVQHGGGNTSVKLDWTDVTGERVPAICVKGSGWDLGDIEPPGLPAMRLAPLLALRPVKALSDEAMVNAQRGALFDSGSPTPSVETLLHAWAPYRFVDHSHANAVLSLTDTAQGEALARAVFGPKIAVVPYVMPGYGLAQAAADVIDAHPDAEGMVLLKHGFFTWGDTARESYERHIRYVTLAEERLAQSPRPAAQASFPSTVSLAETASLAEAAPILRGLLSDAAGKALVLEHRADAAILAWAADPERARRVQTGPVTPDHVIRTKSAPLVLATAGAAADFRAQAKAALDAYAAAYQDYFDRNAARVGGGVQRLDPAPRVVLVEGLGLFGVGASKKDAAIAADIAETTLSVIADAEALGGFEPLPEADIFDVEYWSLEQAKLGKAAPKPLAGKVVAVTGGRGAIGAAVAQAFKAQGAEVAVLDLPGSGAAFACDVTDPASVDAAFAKIVETFGGLDILVSNAGAAWQGRIGTVDEQVLRDSFELNFWGHQRCAQAALRIFQAQRTGGVLLFNASKQAINPGPDFGPYGLPKAATLALMRQYAVDHGAQGVRANAVNADRIRSGLLTDDMVATRSKARGLSEADYMGGNLLGEEVRASDVAQAFVALALAERTTGAVLTVDGGNIAAALR
jgi:rhamnose utilization protein RhaD (predicted bifunctional aldolase and dehydrogenase)/NAD(P)-dependent dehydrogenase (short-subunit alcohol dehydrogenase family)